MDPIIDNNDPQQLNGYAYSNNSPVTFSDPTGLRSCGPDGVLCGWPNSSIKGPNHKAEKETFTRRARVAQFVQSQADEGARKARRAAGISDEEYARALADAHKTKWDVIKEVAWEAVKDISGWNDIVDCFTKGDIWACGGMIAGLVPWGKIGKVLEAGYKAVKAVSSLASIVEKARGVLRRVDSITDEAQRVANEAGAKLGDAGESCALHSFVGSTRVLMADGSTKPISEVDIGDKVKATDPATGETTDREVVGTIVHSDEGDMTRLTVRAEDGTTGSVDATSWHPVWSEAQDSFVDIGGLRPGQVLTSTNDSVPTVAEVRRYTNFESVHDLTVEGAHTYYVLVGATPILVHNCGRAGLDFTDAERQKVYDANAAKNGGECRCDYCGQKVERRGSRDVNGNPVQGRPDDAQIDHVEPRASGGHGGAHNGAVACRRCNRDKSTKTMEEWDDELRDFLDL
ncbi:hypothetical protein JOF41_003558 [Saccharothrix coeruleofusca]|nr:hypothetical protein [Saccharothrix coeruleofusca]